LSCSLDDASNASPSKKSLLPNDDKEMALRVQTVIPKNLSKCSVVVLTDDTRLASLLLDKKTAIEAAFESSPVLQLNGMGTYEKLNNRTGDYAVVLMTHVSSMSKKECVRALLGFRVVFWVHYDKNKVLTSTIWRDTKLGQHVFSCPIQKMSEETLSDGG